MVAEEAAGVVETILDAEFVVIGQMIRVDTQGMCKALWLLLRRIRSI